MENTTRDMLLYDAQKKSTLVAYLLYFIFGFFLQLHRFYAGNKSIALFLLLCPILGFMLFPIFPIIGGALISFYCFIGFFDLFYIPFMVKNRNLDLIKEIEQMQHNK